MENKYEFFWGGMFSNWYPSTFVVDGITFNCGEQFMMYEKAMTFGDKGTAKLIMETNNPSIQKELGRQVQNYDDSIWAKVRYEKVKRGLLEKFKQEPFYSYLKERKDMIIVEASPYDRIWGIGYHENSRYILKEKDKWGENLLGKCIMEIAKELF
jgi:ribA/ribD-fused uncharacterized protein